MLLEIIEAVPTIWNSKGDNAVLVQQMLQRDEKAGDVGYVFYYMTTD